MPITSQLKNHAQLLLDIPVNKYKHVLTPNNGIKEYFLIKVSNASNTQVNQKTINEICGVATSIYVAFPAK